MPRVPKYEPQVQDGNAGIPQSLIADNRPDDANGLGVIKELGERGQKALDLIQSIHDDEMKKADDAGSWDDDIKLSKIEGSLMSDATSKRGINAFNLIETVGDSWSKEVSELDSSTKRSPRRREAFMRNVTLRQSNMNAKLGDFVRGETQRYRDERLTERAETLQREATDSYLHLGIVNQKLGEIGNTVRSYAQDHGKPVEWVANKLAGIQSQVHIGVTARMVDAGQWRMARDYYEKNKLLVMGEDREQLERTIRSGEIRTESENITDDIFADKYKFDPSNPISPITTEPGVRTRRELREAIESHPGLAKDDKELTNATKKLAAERLQDMEDDKAAAQEATFNSMYNYVSENKTLDGIPEAQLTLLPPQLRAALEAHAAKLSKVEATVSDKVLLTRFYAHLELPTEHPESLARMSESDVFIKFSKGLSTSDYETVLKAWANASSALRNTTESNAKKQQAETEHKGLVADGDRVLQAFTGSAIGGTRPTDTLAEIAKDKNKSAAYYEFRNLYDTQISAFKSNPENKGRELTHEQKTEILDRIAIEIRTKPSVPIYGGTRTVRSLTEYDIQREDFDTPSEVAAEAYAMYQSMSNGGTPIDADDFADQYEKRIKRYWIAKENNRSREFLAKILNGAE